MAKAIKKFGDARDAQLAEGKRVPCTMPPRTREGKAYPGGKGLRRAYRRLAEAKLTQSSGKSADHGRSAIPNGIGYTVPGAMNH